MENVENELECEHNFNQEMKSSWLFISQDHCETSTKRCIGFGETMKALEYFSRDIVKHTKLYTYFYTILKSFDHLFHKIIVKQVQNIV